MSYIAIRGGEPIRHPQNPWPSWPPTSDRAVELVTQVIRSGEWGGDGPMELQFAQEFASFSRAKYAVPVANGTVAIQLALEALDIGAYDEVIVPGLTWQATALACLDVNAVPVLVDIDPETYCIDIARAEEAITPRTKAIIVVHLFGAMANMDALLAMAEDHNLHVVEDCAHQHGSQWNGQGVGTMGAIGCYSCQASKILTSGEGGIMLTEDWERFQLLHALKTCGRKLLPSSPTRLSGNFRITEMQAALLLAQMETLEERVDLRDANGQHLSSRLGQIPGISPMRRYPQVTRQSYYGYPFRYDSEAWGGIPGSVFRKALSAETGLRANTTYDPLNNSELYQPHSKKRYHLSDEHWTAIDPRQYDLPVAEKAFNDEAVIIPHSFLVAEQCEVDQVADAVEKLYNYRGELKGLND